jgi:hypothetical protein
MGSVARVSIDGETASTSSYVQKRRSQGPREVMNGRATIRAWGFGGREISFLIPEEGGGAMRDRPSGVGSVALCGREEEP